MKDRPSRQQVFGAVDKHLSSAQGYLSSFLIQGGRERYGSDYEWADAAFEAIERIRREIVHISTRRPQFSPSLDPARQLSPEERIEARRGILAGSVLDPRQRDLPHHSATIPAREFIAEKIRKLREEGYPQKQAIAIAYEEARRAGYRSVPESPRRRRR